MKDPSDAAKEKGNEEGAGFGAAPSKSSAFALFLPEDRKEAQRVFNSLPLKSQLETVLQARGKERLYHLFLSENSEQLVQWLPELEIYLTVHEVGAKDALDLISLTTPEQFQYLIDLDSWKKDDLDPEKLLHWMEILLETGEKKVVQFIRSADPELIALIAKKFLRVTVLEGEPLEVNDRIPPFTLDQYYFIHFLRKETRAVFQPLLQTLYRVNPNAYRRLMEALIIELDTELEETGYRLRNGRLADYGFPGFEEALEIYRYLNPDSLVPGRTPGPDRMEEETEKAVPTFYFRFTNESPFLSSVLGRIEDPLEVNRLKEEIAALCNKAMMAESIDLFTPEEMERVTRKVFRYLNLGVQYLSREEETRALEIVRSFPSQKIFQAGVSLTVRLKKRADTLLRGTWFEGDRENLLLLDPPYAEKFEGILRKRPGIYRNGILHDFATLQELKEMEIFLESIEVIVTTLGERLHVSPRHLKQLDLKDCHPEDWRRITLSTIFLTALANLVLKRIFQFEAIERSRFKDLLSRIFDRNEQGKGVLKMEIKAGIKDWLDSIEGDENKRQHLAAFRDFCLDLLGEELGRISPEGEIDPRFVKGLLIRS
jgi:hypothetical protein